MENKELKTEVKIRRIGGYLHRITTFFDKTGHVVQFAMTPFMVELRLRDIMQIIVGSALLAIPVAFTEEVWNLGERLPLRNVVSLSILSLIMISLFVYFNFYRYHLRKNVFNYTKRVIATYVLSLIVCGTILTIIQKCPWETNYLLAVKRVIIVAFPASLMATVADIIK
jgi:uncharacterized membrane protein